MGWDYNPSVICFANATSLCTREAIASVGCGGRNPPLPERRLFLLDGIQEFYNSAFEHGDVALVHNGVARCMYTVHIKTEF